MLYTAGCPVRPQPASILQPAAVLVGRYLGTSGWSTPNPGPQRSGPRIRALPKRTNSTTPRILQRWPAPRTRSRLLPSSLSTRPPGAPNSIISFKTTASHIATRTGIVQCSLALVAIIPGIGHPHRLHALPRPAQSINPRVRNTITSRQHRRRQHQHFCTNINLITSLNPPHLTSAHHTHRTSFPSPHSAFHQAKTRDVSAPHNNT